MDLVKKHCTACEGGVLPMSPEQANKYLSAVLGWALTEDKKGIRREFVFEDFKKTMEFVNKVADIAENEGHHPEFRVSYGSVVIELSTHAIGGLSENDFIVAAKINALL